MSSVCSAVLVVVAALLVTTLCAAQSVGSSSTDVALDGNNDPSALIDCFLSMGDWGGDNDYVKQLASRLDNIIANPQLFGCRDVKFLFALGDNFYETGVQNTSDPQWDTTYRQQFRNSTKTPALANLPFYIVVGNHDYGTDRVVVRQEFVQAQIDYSAIDPLWRFPDTNYTVNVSMSGVQMHFVMMNTEPMHLCADGSDMCFQQDQPSWVDARLAAVDDDADVAVVAAIGHHNLISPLGGHVDPEYDALLSPVLERHRVSFTLFGHSHFIAWGKNPRVTSVAEQIVNDNNNNQEANGGDDVAGASSPSIDFPGSLWYITNGAARGSDWNNCSWAVDNPLLDKYCAPSDFNSEGSFMLHRVIPSSIGSNGGSSSSSSTGSTALPTTSYVEHCVYSSATGTKGDCVFTPFRSLERRATTPPVSSPLLSWPEISGIAVGGAALVIGCVAMAVRLVKHASRRRSAALEAQNLCSTSVEVVGTAAGDMPQQQQYKKKLDSFGTSVEM